MRSTKTSNYQYTRLRHILFANLVVIGGLMSFAQQPTSSLPRVISAGVPFYPTFPRMAGIQGVVRIKVGTNGVSISEIKIESGSEKLAKAAVENIKTWKLREHSPTTFEVIFKYILSAEAECPQDKDEVIVLRLPSEVEITAKRVKDCDPVVQ